MGRFFCLKKIGEDVIIIITDEGGLSWTRLWSRRKGMRSQQFRHARSAREGALFCCDSTGFGHGCLCWTVSNVIFVKVVER